MSSFWFSSMLSNKDENEKLLSWLLELASSPGFDLFVFSMEIVGGYCKITVP